MRELAPLALFGIDVGHLVGDVVRALIDLLVPDFTGRWANRLVSWLVALPEVTDVRQFPALNTFRRELTYAGYGLLSLSFAGAALQAWIAGLVDGRPVALQAVSRTVMAAGALAFYPNVVGALVLAVNHASAAIIRHPSVADGINTAIGGAFVIGVVTSGLSLGLAAGALLAALYFLAAIFVMKIALTAMLCVLLVSGALVIALWPLPQGEGLAKLWGAGLVAAVTIPVSWALVFSVAGLVASDSLVGDRLGPGLELAVKPFVAVSCLYLVYKTPGFLVLHARMLGMRVGGAAAMVRAPGQARLGHAAQGQSMLQRDRFRGLRAAVGRSARAPMRSVTAAAGQTAGKAGRPLRAGAATAVVNATAMAGGRGPAAGAVTALALGTSRLASGATRAGTAVAGGRKTRDDWWRQPAAARRRGEFSRPDAPGGTEGDRHFPGRGTQLAGPAKAHDGIASWSHPEIEALPDVREPLRRGRPERGSRQAPVKRDDGRAPLADDLRAGRLRAQG